MAGSGDYVQVGEGNVTYSGAGMVGGENLLSDKYDETMGMANEYDSKVQEYLDELAATLDLVTLPDGWEDLISDVELDPIPELDPTTAPDVGNLDLNDDWSDNFPLAPLLKATPEVDLSYTEPTEPLDVDPTISYIESPYHSYLFDILFEKLYEGIRDGGTGLGAEVEQAIFDRARERQRISNEREYQRALDASSASGFDFAGGAQAALLAEMGKEILQQDSNINNDILIEQARLAQNNTQFMISQGATVESMLRDFHNNSENRAFEVQRATAQFILQKFSEKWRGYIAQWEGIKTELEAKRETMNVIIRENELKIQAYLGELDGIKSKNEAVKSENDGKVEAFRGEVEAFRAQVEERDSIRREFTEYQKLKIEQVRLELDKAVQELRITLDSQVSVNSLRERIIEAMSNISANVLASALNAVNASISHSTSSGKSLSEAWSHSDSIAEGHSYEHDPTT